MKFEREIVLSLNQIAGALVFFVIGFYGYPDLSLQHTTNAGLTLRVIAISIIFFLVVGWIISLFGLRTNRNGKSNEMRIVIGHHQLLNLMLFFPLITIFKYRELSSSITGDEISLYGYSIETSVLVMDVLTRNTSLLDQIPARYVIAFLQFLLILIAIIFYLYLKKRKSTSRISLYLFAIIVFYSFRKLFFNGTYAYPNAEVLPYFILSPVTLVLNLNPRLISYLLFAVFLVAIHNLCLKSTKSHYFSYSIIILFISFPMTSDISTSINHGVYYVYFLTYFLTRIVFGFRIDHITILALLLFSIFRPTLFPILLLLIAFLFYRKETLRRLKSLLHRYFFVISSISFVHGIIIVNRSTDFAFAFNAGAREANTSFDVRLSGLLESLFNLDVISVFLLFFLLITSLREKNFIFIGTLLSSIFIFVLTAHPENLKAPIYKTEILLPFVYLACIKGLTYLRSVFDRIKNGSTYTVTAWGLISLIFISSNVIYMNDMKFSSISWSESVENNEGRNERPYVTYGKVNYNEVVEGLGTKFSGCKFLDVTYSGSFLLGSNIRASNFTELHDSLNIDLSELSEKNLGQCVIVGNYSLTKLVDHVNQEALQLDLIARYTNEILGTTLYVFKTKKLS